MVIGVVGPKRLMQVVKKTKESVRTRVNFRRNEVFKTNM